MSADKQMEDVFARYRSHPQFIGVEISDPNQKGDMGDTLLHLAAEMGNVQDIEALVRAGAAINASGDIGNTPLHGAALLGKTAAVAKLLALGADPTLKNEFGETPLDVAQQGRRREIIELFENRSIQR